MLLFYLFFFLEFVIICTKDDFIILIISCDEMKRLHRWRRIDAIDHVTHQARNYLRRLRLNDDCSLNFVITSIALSRSFSSNHWLYSRFQFSHFILYHMFFLFSILSTISSIFHCFSSSMRFEVCIICFIFLSSTRWRYDFNKKTCKILWIR